MIDLDLAKKAFQKYLEDFDLQNGKIGLKIRHTYGVMKISEYIANDLNLAKEDIQLAILIALLHDIGRFEQARTFQDFRDHMTVDHGKLGVQILFKDNLIREFIEDDQYDDIIKTAIFNHNKFELEPNLKGRELLHSQIIRDADKTDNFRVKTNEDLKNIFGISMEETENSKISKKIFDDIMNNKMVINEDRQTELDNWVGLLGFIFDFNFNSGLKYIKKEDYINRVVDRLDYKDHTTKVQMEEIRKHELNYIDQRLENETEQI